MTRTKLFRSNRLRAVRLPESLAFPDQGGGAKGRVVIAPSNAAYFFDSPGIDLLARSELMKTLYPKEYTGWILSGS